MRRTIVGGLVWLAAATLGFAQTAPRPTTDADVREHLSRFKSERADAEKLAGRFADGTLARADGLVAKAEAALGAGRLFQAAELVRQARWQLPYSPRPLPEHVSRVFGSFRLRHGGEVLAVAFSPDGKTLATGGADRVVSLWDLGNGREAIRYVGHADSVRALAFSPDGKTLASGASTIRLWSTADGKDLREIPGPGGSVTALAFSRDGKHLVSGHTGKEGASAGQVTVHETTGKLVRTIDDFRQHVTSLAFNAPGSIVAVGAGDGATRLYEYPKIVENPATPEYWAHQENQGATTHVTFTADDRYLVRCGLAGVRIYDVPRPGAPAGVATPRRTIANPSPEHHHQVALGLADGRTLVVGGSDGMLRAYDADTGKLVTAAPTHAATALALHPTTGQVASAGGENAVRLVDMDLGAQSTEFVGHEGPVWHASFRRDGARAVSASADKTVRIWDVVTGKAIHVLKGHSAPATLALFAPDGKRVFSAGADRVVRAWDAETGAALGEWTEHDGAVTAMDLSADGSRLVTGGADRKIVVWDVATGKPTSVVKNRTSIVAAVALHPKGDRFAVGNVDQTIELFDVSGKPLKKWAGHGVAVTSLAYSPDGRRLASAGADGLVKIWMPDEQVTLPLVVSGHAGPVSSVAFRSDGQHFVSCGADLVVKLWKIQGSPARVVQSYQGHREWVTSATFSADGDRILSASVDRSVKVWELASRDIPVHAEHFSSVDVVAFDPAGNLATGSADRVVRVWDRKTGAVRATIAGNQSSVVAVAFAPDGTTLFTSSLDRTIRMWNAETGVERPRSDSQKQSWTGLLRTPPLLLVANSGKQLLAWAPRDEQSTTIVAYDVEGNEQFTLVDQNRKIHSLCFSADGKGAATGAANGTVRVWNLEQKSVLPGGDWFLFDEKVSVADLALTPDRKTIVVTSEQGDVKIADVTTREVRKTLKAHPGKILGCVVSPDGARFLTWDAENTVKVWNLATGAEVRSWRLGPLFQEQASSVLNVAFAPDSKSIALGTTWSVALSLELP